MKRGGVLASLRPLFAMQSGPLLQVFGSGLAYFTVQHLAVGSQNHREGQATAQISEGMRQLAARQPCHCHRKIQWFAR